MAMTFQIEDRGNGIKWVEVNRQDMYDIARWCQDHGCGKQVNTRKISFKNEEDLTMFLLKWQEQTQ
jgi:hypothetical protein